MKKNKQKEFIENFRWKIYDCFYATVNDIENRKYEVVFSGNHKQIWVYKDEFNGYRITTFPVDLLYINLFKGCSNFYYYIKHKLDGS